MYYKHTLIPRIKPNLDSNLRASEEAKICMTCNLDSRKCSERCKRHKEKLGELKNSK